MKRVKSEPIRGAIGVLARGGRFLVIRRAAAVPDGGSWCFPGGALEVAESFAEAVVREMREEVGLAVRAERELWRWHSADQRLELRWWLVREPCAGPVLSNEAEVAETAWLTPDQIGSLHGLLGSNRSFLHAVRTGHVVLD